MDEMEGRVFLEERGSLETGRWRLFCVRGECRTDEATHAGGRFQATEWRIFTNRAPPPGGGGDLGAANSASTKRGQLLIKLTQLEVGGGNSSGGGDKFVQEMGVRVAPCDSRRP